MEIVLIRHGKPVAAEHGEQVHKMTSADYAAWVRAYNHSSVSLSSKPASAAAIKYPQHYCISSNLKRAVESATISTQTPPKQQWPILKEMDVPRYKLPGQFKPYHWLLISRILWLLGFEKRLSHRVESFKQAKERAQSAAEQLIILAEEQQHVIVFAHGVTNRLVSKALMKQGWLLTQKSNKFWGETCLRKK